MKDKNQPRIRMVTLDKILHSENSGNRSVECDCENDTCPECRVQCICHPECSCDSKCSCHPICSCDHIEKPCVVDPQPCRTVIPKKSNNESEDHLRDSDANMYEMKRGVNLSEKQSSKKVSNPHQTFFKIAEKGKWEEILSRTRG